MKNEQKHTELPWNFYEGAEYYLINSGNITRICVADIKREFANAEANAQFIVKACNSHYELLEALKKAKSILGIWENDYEEIKKIIEQAIQKAEGKV